ncbi:E2F-associated phosphoprotein-like isoform X2 [Centruroides sculpturatus]|nr:E2F-associated phosphoprotein-like isoform X2 [Centruroides sculpturatus]
MDFDDYVVNESSEEESDNSESSDDELQTFIREEYGIKKENNIHDFENEMEEELNKQIKNAEETIMNKNLEQSSIINDHSDDKVLGKNGKSTSPSNDDLLYDPNMDDDDQVWIDNQRRLYTFPNCNNNCNQKPLPNSDAVLNCPACLSLLCLDCQRHEIYKSQYRAMFVKNCSVDTSQKLYYPIKGKKKTANQNMQDEYYSVNCSICKTAVAVYDKDEVYHFFNVISSFA